MTLHFPPFNHYLSGSSTEPLDMQDCLDKRIVDAISETYNFTYQVCCGGRVVARTIF